MSDDNTIELNRRRVLGGIVTVGAAAAAAGAGTFALFSDTEESSGNTVQAGTLNLQDTETTSFPVDNLVPGDEVEGTVKTIYDSDSDVDPVNVTASLTLSENDLTPTPESNTGNLSASEFAGYISMDTAELNDGKGNSHNIESNSGTTNGPNDTSYTSLADVVEYDIPDDALSNVAPGNTVTLDLVGTFVSGAGNDAQGEGIDLDVTFTANQPDTQS